MITRILLHTIIVLLVSVGARAFEEDQRINSLTIQFGTDTFATQNAFGAAFPNATVQGQLQTAITSSVNSGTTSLLFEMLGLTDLTGANQAAFNVGVVNGFPVLDASNPTQYSGASDLDWWYISNPAEITPAGVPLNQLPAQIAASVLTAGPGRISFSAGTGTAAFVMSNTTIKANVGSSSAPLQSTNGFPPGHLPSENIPPALVSFASMSAGQLKGNISAASLALTPIPPFFVGDGNGYTATNTLLDVIVGGDTQFGGLIVVVKATQPDSADPGAPALGAGPPYKLVTNAAKAVIAVQDKNGAAVDFTAGLSAATYSAYYKFTTDRVFVLPPAPEIAVQQPAGTNITDGASKDFGSVSVGATKSLTFTIRNLGNADLTGLVITIDGADASMFTLTASPTAPVGPGGTTTFAVEFAPTIEGAKSAALHIASNDVNESPFDINLTGSVNGAPTDIALSASTIAENQPSGTIVGSLSTTDPDGGGGFTYTLVSGSGSADNASFSIAGGSLKTAAVFDFETKSSYQIRVRSTDPGALFFEKEFTITVTDINEQAPVFTSAPTAAPNPALVNQTVAFSAAVTSPTPVTITWDFGDGTSKNGANVSHAYGTGGNYTVTVTATNSGSSSTQPLFVHILETQTFATQKATLKFSFTKHQDSLTISGPVVLPANFTPDTKSISVMIGTYAKTQTLTAKGKTATDANNVFALTGKLKKGTFTSTAAKLTLTLKKQNLFDSFTGFGFTNATIKIPPQAIQITAVVIIDGAAYIAKPVFSYTAKAGVSGAGKLMP